MIQYYIHPTSVPSINDDIDIVPGESLLCILRDFLGIGVKDVISALHNVY